MRSRQLSMLPIVVTINPCTSQHQWIPKWCIRLYNPAIYEISYITPLLCYAPPLPSIGRYFPSKQVIALIWRGFYHESSTSRPIADQANIPDTHCALRNTAHINSFPWGMNQIFDSWALLLTWLIFIAVCISNQQSVGWNYLYVISFHTL